MKAKEYALLQRCIEDGIERGHQRAYKHDDDPPKDHIKNAICESVMTEVCEWFDFPESVEQ